MATSCGPCRWLLRLPLVLAQVHRSLPPVSRNSWDHSDPKRLVEPQDSLIDVFVYLSLFHKPAYPESVMICILKGSLWVSIGDASRYRQVIWISEFAHICSQEFGWQQSICRIICSLQREAPKHHGPKLSQLLHSVACSRSQEWHALGVNAQCTCWLKWFQKQRHAWLEDRWYFAWFFQPVI